MVEVNLKEMAERVKCSLPTMARMVERYPEFPVIERGSNGKPWRFDAGAVIEFLRAKMEEQAAAEAARDEELAQLTLPIIPTDEKPKGELSIDERLKAAKLREIEMREAKEKRFLVPTHEVRAALERALRRFGAAQDSAIERVTRTHNLPEAVKRALVQELAVDARTAFVRDAGEFLMQPEATEEGLFARHG